MDSSSSTVEQRSSFVEKLPRCVSSSVRDSCVAHFLCSKSTVDVSGELFSCYDPHNRDKTFYVGCLSGAVREWMEVQMGVTLRSADEVRRGSSYAANIFLKYLDTAYLQVHEKVD
ncbi:MAG: hypothetical protein LBB21_02060 [Holosporaceae bacterium]|jgi:hypothetical protein|nr:hypothetical protein [Holosporaceae bacterium]